MRIIIQRAKNANIVANGIDRGSFSNGLVVLVGIEDTDSQEDIQWLVKKITNLRVFNDEQGVMNLSLLDTGGDLMIVSQFTLHASTKKGNRPSYIKAAKPAIAIPLYEAFVEEAQRVMNKPVYTGEFGADMQINFTNDGPVTIMIDSKNKE
ncbi:D-aminoacyl-tRNA deacylase [Persicobacter psychrovividus]|uniref:D-aminoacyl-tRNA deacylase n=1 Tax=Persicobacter psychrovividus TaxID=387638 RepID=A0ABN6L5D0_9BACT|nr:D-aminoacyl-tRNA deacylase [Persicobacter psychrovividus]